MILLVHKISYFFFYSRPDIPLHALAMLKIARDGIVPDVDGSIGPLAQYDELKKKVYMHVYVYLYV